MTRRVDARAESWPLARPFAISRGVKTAADTVVVEIEHDGAIGRGECVPYPRYGESQQSVLAAVHGIADRLKGGLDRIGLLQVLPAGAARNAVDAALWDLEAKTGGRRVWQLAGLPEPGPVDTAVTIGIDTPEAMAERAKELSDYPLLKVKLDREQVMERLAAIREAAPAPRLVVDPNEGWDVGMLAALVRPLADLGCEMIEQPVPAGDDAGLREISSPVPICADEACHTASDLDRLQRLYDMVNIKLDKTGGLTAALELKKRAEAGGFGLMVGCMVAGSLAMAPAVLVAQACRIVDLDGPILLKQDRDPSLAIEAATIQPPAPELWG